MTLSRAIYDAILAHGEREWPREACGFLLGDASIDESIAITNAAESMKGAEFTRNAEDGYVMDPGEQYRAERDAEKRGKRVLGVYHSHPDVGAYFSAEDRRRALFDGEPIYPDAVWLVADIRQKKALGAKAFEWDERARDFVEIPLEIV